MSLTRWCFWPASQRPTSRVCCPTTSSHSSASRCGAFHRPAANSTTPPQPQRCLISAPVAAYSLHPRPITPPAALTSFPARRRTASCSSGRSTSRAGAWRSTHREQPGRAGVQADLCLPPTLCRRGPAAAAERAGLADGRRCVRRRHRTHPLGCMQVNDLSSLRPFPREAYTIHPCAGPPGEPDGGSGGASRAPTDSAGIITQRLTQH